MPVQVDAGVAMGVVVAVGAAVTIETGSCTIVLLAIFPQACAGAILSDGLDKRNVVEVPTGRCFGGPGSRSLRHERPRQRGFR